MFQATEISKRYGDVRALAPLSLTIGQGETVAVVGPSGGGKTTLLRVLAGVVPPDRGEVLVDGRPLAALQPGRELARLVGMMPQGNDLVPSLSVIHNVLAGRLGEWGLLRSLGVLIAPRRHDRELAWQALERVGVGDKLYERAGRLSGGEQQRVALARLLVQDPRAVLADEPVSSVDPARAVDVIRLLTGIAAEDGRTLVVTLHAVPLALGYFERIIALRQGRLIFDRPAALVRPDDLDALYALESSADTLAAAG